jgi:hypothetical protein
VNDRESGVVSAGVATPAAREPLRPEPADVVRLGRRLVRLVVAAAQDEAASEAPADRPLRVTDAHMSAALDRLLDTRSQLTRALLGARAPQDTAPAAP